MPAPPRPTPPSDEESFSAWPLIISIGFVKLTTLITILYLAWGRESAKLIGATIGPWLGVTVAILSAPVAWHWRMRRMRRRRDALLHAEFHLDQNPTHPPIPSPESA